MGKVLILITAVVLPCAAQTYDIPNQDAECPGNCRQIPWSAGSDQWNNGTLPRYTAVACAGLTEGNGTTNNASILQTCLNNLSAGQAAVIPPGIYYINGTISIPSNKALRGSGSTNCTQGKWLSTTFSGDTGSGAACTTLKLGSSAAIRFGSSTPAMGAERAIASGYNKGSRSLTLSTASHGLVAGDWVSIFEDTDPAIVSAGNKGCSWCGDDSGSNLIQQFAQVTSVSSATIGISRPMYYTYLAGQAPGVKKVTFSTQRAGIEDLKINGFADINNALIDIRGAVFTWVRNVETYNASANNSGHIMLRFSHGVEIRDSYSHTGRDSGSGSNYGLFSMFWNSDHKFENNILRAHRHSIAFEGGGSGYAILYNYIDDNWEDEDRSYLGAALTNHGPHPMYNLWEGNVISHLESDDVFGGSSHIVRFRNWLWGDETDAPDRTGAATWGFRALDIRGPQRYHSAIGNVLGKPSWTGGTLRTTQSSQCGASGRVAYYIACQDGSDYSSGFDSVASTTLIAHGNYDYVSRSVAFWEGGSNHTLKPSMYYTAPPAFFSGYAWPPIGPEPSINPLPAQARYAGTDTGPVTRPPAPTNLQATPR